MAKNVLQSTILSGAGAVAIAPGAQIEVRSPSGLLVPLWLDRDGTQPTTNPTTADSDGFFRVYLNSGRYHITARSGAESREWRDVLLGSAAGYDVDDMLAALAAGVYTSVAEGLASTAEGDFFWVAHETGEDVLTLYRVVDGEAELWAALPRGDIVRELTARAESAAEAAEADAQAAADALAAILALGDLPSAVAAAEQAAQSASDSATAAATSESIASTAATAAEQAAQRAEDAAADTGLPSPIVPDTFLQAKADGSGYAAVSLVDVQRMVLRGIPFPFPGETPPPGTIAYDGAELLRDDFPELWAWAQTHATIVTDAEWHADMWGAFSSGDGVTTFRVPDLRGEHVRGWDAGRGIDVDRVLGAHQMDALQNITGSFRSRGEVLGGAFSAGVESGSYQGGTNPARIVHFDASLVARTADETRGRNIAYNYCAFY